MSFRSLVTGSLATDPIIRKTASGNEYATCHIRVDNKDESFLASVSGFGAHVPELLKLKKADSVSIAGPSRLSRWKARDGSEAFGVRIVAEQITALKAARRPAHEKNGRRPNRPKLSLTKAPSPPPLDDGVNDLFRDGDAAE